MLLKRGIVANVMDHLGRMQTFPFTGIRKEKRNERFNKKMEKKKKKTKQKKTDNNYNNVTVD